MMTDRDKQAVVGVREALVSVPLWATPALEAEQLQRVKFLQVSYRGDGPDRIESLLGVAEVRKRNATDVSFVSLTPGRSVVVTNGVAYLEDLATEISPALATRAA